MRDKSRKRIVIVLSSLSTGGTEREVVNIVNHLNMKRFEVQIWLFNKKGSLLKQVDKKIKIVDYKKKNKLSFIRIVFQMSKMIKEFKPDLIIQFTTNHSGIVSLLAKKFSGERTSNVISLRNLTSIKIKIQRKWSFFIPMIGIKFFYRWADMILVNSKAIKNDLVEVFNLRAERIKIIFSTVDWEKVKKLSTEKIDLDCVDKDYLLVVSRLVEQKRVDLIIRAFYLIKDRVRQNLVIVGDGPEEKELKKLVDKLDLEKRVIFIGNQINPYKYMKKAELLLLGSEIEGCPHVVIEAMMLGTLCMTTRYLGVDEVITSNCGYIFKSGDLKGISEEIFKALNNKKQNKLRIKRGWLESKKFEISREIKKYEAFFETAMSV